jgi:acetylornithine deacetylase/succinyl-diaminopimelate desuccinylase-like protein
MRDRDGNVTIDGFYDQLRQPSALERRALSALAVDLEAVKREVGSSRLEAEDGLDFARRLSFRPSLNANGFHSGYDGPGTKPILPHRAVAKCDVRLVADQGCDEVFEQVQAHVEAVSPDVGILRLPASMEPSQTPLDTPLAESVRLAIIAAQGVVPVLVPVAGGSAPSHVFTGTLGCPTLLVPYANTDEANHAPNENLELDRYFAGIKTAAAIVAFVGAAEVPRGE